MRCALFWVIWNRGWNSFGFGGKNMKRSCACRKLEHDLFMHTTKKEARNSTTKNQLWPGCLHYYFIFSESKDLNHRSETLNAQCSKKKKKQSETLKDVDPSRVVRHTWKTTFPSHNFIYHYQPKRKYIGFFFLFLFLMSPSFSYSFLLWDNKIQLFFFLRKQ